MDYTAELLQQAIQQYDTGSSQGDELSPVTVLSVLLFAAKDRLIDMRIACDPTAGVETKAESALEDICSAMGLHPETSTEDLLDAILQTRSEARNYPDYQLKIENLQRQVRQLRGYVEVIADEPCRELRQCRTVENGRLCKTCMAREIIGQIGYS